MPVDQIVQWAQLALAGGCGLVMAWAYQIYLDGRPDGGVGITPYAKRLTIMALSVVVPTALYLVVVFYKPEEYNILLNIYYVAVAYLGSQIAHGGTLPHEPSIRVAARPDNSIPQPPGDPQVGQPGS